MWRRLFPRSGPWYRRWWLPLTGGGLALVGFLAVSGLFVLFYRQADIPAPDELRIPEPTVVYDAFGDEIATLDPAAVRENIDLGDLPGHVPQAVLAAEDREFRSHPGFSVRGIVRSFYDNLTSGDEIEGGSTITQQYVEIAIREVARSYLGKLREIAYATKLERQLPKDEILERYLNAVPLGRGAIGIEAAAQTYFAKSATELNVNEAATLAGMIAAPSRFDPGQNPGAADVRREYVLRGMHAEGWIEEARLQELVDAGLPEIRQDPLVDYGLDGYFLDAVRRRLTEEFSDRDVFTGLEVHTTLHPDMQQTAIETLREHLGELPYTGSVVSVDPGTGAVFSLAGGLDFDRQQFNVAVQGKRQPGSAFKPFTLATFVREGRSPQAIYDAPAEIEIDTETGPYEVANFENQAFGEIDVRTATINSVNTVFVQLQQDVGTQDLVETAHDAGIRSDLQAVPSLTLGTSGVTPLEMANAYGTFAAGGTRAEPFFVREAVERESGDVVYRGEDETEQTMEANVAAVVTDILRDNVRRGTGTAAQIGRAAAGKTGTTQSSRDAWFVGYVPQLSTAVWIGNLDNTPMEDVTGGSIPARVWGDYMEDVLEGQDVLEFPDPDFSGLEAERTEPYEPVERETSESTPSPSPSAPETSASPSPGETSSPDPSPTESESGDGLPMPDDSPSPSPDDSEESPSPSPDSDSSSSSPSESDDDSSPSASPDDSDGTESTSDDTTGGSSADGTSSSPSPSPSPS